MMLGVSGRHWWLWIGGLAPGPRSRRQVSSLSELGDEFGLRTGPLAPVARAAEELQVVAVVGPALGPGDVVDLEDPEGEHHPASAAVALLIPEQVVLVGPVVREVAQIGASGALLSVAMSGPSPPPVGCVLTPDAVPN